MKNIDKNKLYLPEELADFDLGKKITAKKKDSRRQKILEKIRRGELRANNFGSQKQPRYLVKGKDFEDYLKSDFKSDNYLKG